MEMSHHTHKPALDECRDTIVLLDQIPEEGTVGHVPMLVHSHGIRNDLLDGFASVSTSDRVLEVRDMPEENDLNGSCSDNTLGCSIVRTGPTKNTLLVFADE